MENVYEIKIILKDTKPPVWRRLAVSNVISMYELHHAIQLAFGWENYHLYAFMKNSEFIGNPDLMDDIEAIDDKTLSLGEVLKKINDSIEYEYDFGDSWLHSIKLEKIKPADIEIKSPVCTGGKMACPPEDCGGTTEYDHLVKVMSNSKHPEYKEMLEWLGKPFDHEIFDLQEVNNNLKGIKKYIKQYEANNHM